jgi:hypothetical protein
MAAPFLPDPADLWAGADLPDPDDAARLLDDQPGDYPDADDTAVAALLDGDTPHWRIDGDQDAEWVMSLAGPTDASLAAIEAQEREYVDRVRDWSRRMSAPLLSRRGWITAQLTAWALRRRADTRGQIKTFKVPSGEVRTRKAPDPSPTIVDMDAVVAWAKLHHPDIVDVKESVKVAALGKVVKVGAIDVVDPQTGEVRKVEAVTHTVHTDDGARQVMVPGTGVHHGTTSVTVVPYEVS